MKKIRTLQIAPQERPKICYIAPTIEAFRKAVNADNILYGDVEAKKLDTHIFTVFNKDRFLANFIVENAQNLHD